MDDGKRYTFRRAKSSDGVPWSQDKGCIMFCVQTFIGVGLLVFCALSLWVEQDCNKEAPYWGLIGTLCGFFFRKVASEGGAKIMSISRGQKEDVSGSSNK
jgi:hypothetical protein